MHPASPVLPLKHHLTHIRMVRIRSGVLSHWLRCSERDWNFVGLKKPYHGLFPGSGFELFVSLLRELVSLRSERGTALSTRRVVIPVKASHTAYERYSQKTDDNPRVP